MRQTSINLQINESPAVYIYIYMYSTVNHMLFHMKVKHLPERAAPSSQTQSNYFWLTLPCLAGKKKTHTHIKKPLFKYLGCWHVLKRVRRSHLRNYLAVIVTRALVNWCESIHGWILSLFKDTNCCTVFQMVVDITWVERYLFVSEGIVHLARLVYETWQAFANPVFWIYVLLKQNWPHLPRSPIHSFWLCFFDPCGLKQWKTKDVSLQITIYILSSERHLS